MVDHELGPAISLLRVLFHSEIDTMACMTVVDTTEGLVLIDGGVIEAPIIQKEIHKTIRSFSSKPIHTIIYTHGHVGMSLFGSQWDTLKLIATFGILQDHIGAAYNFPLLEKGHPKIRVVAHENVAARFDRYKMTVSFESLGNTSSPIPTRANPQLGYNSYINSVQFRQKMPWPTNYVYPDVTYRDEMELTIGGIKFRLFHDKGETDDSTWVHLPHIGAICTGDLFIWATPNCGNPQKAQRYANRSRDTGHCMRHRRHMLIVMYNSLKIPNRMGPRHGEDGQA